MTQSQISLPRLGLYYLGIYVLMVAMVYAGLWAVEKYFSYTPGTNAMGLIVPVLAAMQVGTLWYNHTGTRPANGQAWAAAVMFVVITAVVSSLIATLAYRYGLLPELNELLAYDDAAMVFGIALAIAFVATLVLCRFGIWIGVRQAERLKQRMDAKSAK